MRVRPPVPRSGRRQGTASYRRRRVQPKCVLVDVFPSGETRSRPRVRARRARPWSTQSNAADHRVFISRGIQPRTVGTQRNGALPESPGLWRRRRGEKASRSTAEIAQIHPALLGRGGQPRGEVHCLVEFGCSDGGFLAHIAKNRHLSPGRDQGVGDPIDPDSSSAAIAAILPSDSLQSENAVGARKLPEAQSHHAGVRRHVAILSLPTDCDLAYKRGSRRSYGSSSSCGPTFE